VVLGGEQAAACLALELLLWSNEVTLCTNGELTCDDKTAAQLARNTVRIDRRAVVRLEGKEQQIERVRFADGDAVECRALFFSPAQHQRSPLAEKLGCDFCDEEGCVQAGEFATTSVPGVYAAGNLSRGIQLVIAAAAEGTHAAFAINDALLEADAERGRL
jgi:thioredoxin reductase